MTDKTTTPSPLLVVGLDRKVRNMRKITEDHYQADDGVKMRREYGSTTNGNPMDGRWVLRNEKGEMVDFDEYRHDLEDRYCLKLECA